MSDDISATASYEGISSNGPNISTTSTCTSQDGLNRVSFGDLASGHVGYACWWCDGDGDMTDADFKLNKYEFSQYANKPDNCSSRYSIEAVATHERGHTFGMRHASPESDHRWLTMSPNINGPCQNSEATLGRGDVLGLRQKY